MEVLNPEGVRRGQESASNTLAPRISELDGKVIGILDDGFSGSEYYMRGIMDLVAQSYPGSEVRYWHKDFHTRPAPDELIQEIAGQVDAVVVGIAG